MVIKIDDITYWCSDKEGSSEFHGDAVINLTGIPNIPQLSRFPELAKHIDVAYEEVVIAWPDFGLPRVKAGFWYGLHNCFKNNKWKDVCIHCEGGHGRTGTALSAIMISVLAWDVVRSIEYVREHGCWKMVETPAQTEYLWLLDKELNNSIVEENDVPSCALFIAQQKRVEEERQRGGLKYATKLAVSGDENGFGEK
jgi:protein-tyrosine phosphatase